MRSHTNLGDGEVVDVGTCNEANWGEGWRDLEHTHTCTHMRSHTNLGDGEAADVGTRCSQLGRGLAGSGAGCNGGCSVIPSPTLPLSLPCVAPPAPIAPVVPPAPAGTTHVRRVCKGALRLIWWGLACGPWPWLSKVVLDAAHGRSIDSGSKNDRGMAGSVINSRQGYGQWLHHYNTCECTENPGDQGLFAGAGVQQKEWEQAIWVQAAVPHCVTHSHSFYAQLLVLQECEQMCHVEQLPGAACMPAALPKSKTSSSSPNLHMVMQHSKLACMHACVLFHAYTYAMEVSPAVDSTNGCGGERTRGGGRAAALLSIL
eukprot:1157909-Pelagomonas_calceolata.AAC.9